MKNLINTNNTETMTSAQLAELLGYEKKEVNKKIRNMFGDEKAREKFSPDLDGRGRVEYYNLPELESKMFVAKHDINYLEKITEYWINKQQPITEEDALMKLAQGIIAMRSERDEAIKTKAQINDKRTATIMGKLSGASKKISKLESKLQDVGLYRSIMAECLPQRIDTETSPNVQTWRILKAISQHLGHEIIKADDQRYGKVNTYHVDVIEQFKKDYM